MKIRVTGRARLRIRVYYTVDDAAAEIVIEMVWGARRGRSPEL